MSISEQEILRIKAEGINDIVKWLEKWCKNTNKMLNDLENNSKTAISQDLRDTDIHNLKVRLDTLVQIKVSIEKYMRKLRHQVTESENTKSCMYDKDLYALVVYHYRVTVSDFDVSTVKYKRESSKTFKYVGDAIRFARQESLKGKKVSIVQVSDVVDWYD